MGRAVRTLQTNAGELGSMKVAVSDDNGYAAEAGAEIASRGGNAVDACVAAGFACCVVRSLICGVGGSGFMLVHAGGQAVLLDFSDQVPQRPGSPDGVRMVEVEYAGKSIPVRVGPSTCAVPGTVAELTYALQRFGTADLSDAVAPAIRLAEEGFERDAVADEFVDLLGPILELAGMNPDNYRRGQRLTQPGLGELLQRIGEEGPDAFYRGPVAEEITRTTHLTREDLADYDVIERQPLEFGCADYTALTNPSPSQGGARLRSILRSLDPQSSDEDVARAIRDAASEESSASGHTTHVSCMDDAGNTASLTISLGEGCGIRVPGTEVMLNNTLGEPGVAGGNQKLGDRLPSFMAPTVVLDGAGRARMVLGSPGSSRIPSAIAQVLFCRLLLGKDLQEAVVAPRVHATSEQIYAEPGALDGQEDGVVRYDEKDAFFGGVNVVERSEDGTLRDFADPRRGGGIAYIR